jgi:two-component system, OmpR family, sensor histidine kinase ArlS
MNIRQRLTLRFVIIVASILVGFSVTIYLLSDRYRSEEFFSRLEGRAITTARLLVNVQEVDLNLLRKKWSSLVRLIRCCIPVWTISK